MPEILYDIAIEAPDRKVKVKWGEESRWAETYRDLLDRAERISLLPKQPLFRLPVVTVKLKPDDRWIVFSRIYGQVAGPKVGKTIRMYAIGWQRTVRGVNVKSLTWIYPNGAVEVGEEPTYAVEVLNR